MPHPRKRYGPRPVRRPVPPRRAARTGRSSASAGEAVGDRGLLLGAALAAYGLPGALGALLCGRWLRGLPPARLLAADSRIRAVLLGCAPLAWAAGVLHPVLYVVLLAGSSVLHAWGSAGRYALVAQMLPPDQRLAANALV
ncbi:MFS transporter [Streptomyces amritsarensis]|uniref:hypothetical protein n=1 Tax=Streptomyces amritsarensis TaxID=681158 RepID=UPI0036B95947